jgi:hypothetical protein
MMYKLLPFLSILFAVSSFAQSKDEELIRWSEDQKLTWADYKGKPKPDSDAAASTATYLGIEYNFGNKGFDYKITCSFSKTRSWGLHKTDYILAHEQGHFDIAELFARKLHKEMINYKFNKKTFKDDLKNIYLSITAAKEQMQNDYDKETNHSIIKDKQEEWLKKIDEQLKQYKDFADY